MKNNAICFFVDSVTWNSLGTRQACVSPTPFLDSLVDESITASKLYSHGPYTDAATRSLFTGRDCLDDFGYYFKLNTAPIHHYKAFHDAGYETYNFNYPYFILGSDINKYIDHSIYTTGFLFESEWDGIFKFYHDKIKINPLVDDEYLLLKTRLEVMFDSWGRFLNDCISNPETMRMHNYIFKTYNVRSAFDMLCTEKSKFGDSPYEYIDNLLLTSEEHVLFQLSSVGIEAYINPDFIENFIEKKYGKFLNRVALNTFRANFWSNMPSVRRLFYGMWRYLKTGDSSNLLFLQNYIGSLTPISLMRKRWKKKGWQTQHSARTIYKTGIELLKERMNDKPFYFFFDVEDPHNNISFFSYDTQDKEVIDEEMRVLEDYTKSVGTNFKGNLMYLLSLRYIDYQIQKFCDALKELGLWNNTSILVVSDHGSSYTFNPIHNRRVNCFDDECYHIPMLIRHPGMVGKEIKSYQSSKDILPTFMDVLGLEQCKDFKGRSMLDEHEEREYIISEYMGPGCPDMLQRRIWFSIRDKHFIVAYKVGIYETFDEGELVEVYDLFEDPKAFYNINDRISKAEINYLLIPLKKRHSELINSTNDFMNALRLHNQYKLLK